MAKCVLLRVDNYKRTEKKSVNEATSKKLN